MSLEDFNKKLRQKLQENMISMPVEIMAFPSQEEQPVDSTQSIVTNGETTPLGQSREDKALEQGIGSCDNAVIGEVGNLLLTIGYILKSSSLISDQYDSAQILDFINHNFNQPTNPQEQNPPLTSENPVDNNALPAGFTYFQEQKILKESKKK